MLFNSSDIFEGEVEPFVDQAEGFTMKFDKDSGISLVDVFFEFTLNTVPFAFDGDNLVRAHNRNMVFLPSNG